MAYNSGAQMQISTDSHVLKDLGFTGKPEELPSWFEGLSDVEKEYYRTENPVLLQYIQALRSTNDPYVRQQLEGAYSNFKSQSFNPNFLQNIGELVGDTSARANFNNQLNSGFSGEISRIIEGKHVEDYTSEPAQLERLKESGINTDLNGGSALSAGEPGKIDEAQLQPGVVNDGSNAVEPLFQAGAQIVSFAMQAYQGFMSVKSISLDNLIKEFSLSDNMRSLAWNLIGEGVSEYMTSPEFDESLKDDPSSVAIIPSLVQSFGYRVNTLPLSKKQKTALSKTIDSLVFSFDNGGHKIPTAKYQTLINDTLKNLYGSRADSVQEYGRIGADIEDIAVQRVVSHDIYRPLNDMALKLQEDMNYLKQLQIKYDTSFYETADKIGLAPMTARADFIGKKMQYEIKKVQKRVTDTFRAIDRKIDSNPKIGPNWKMAFQTALAMGESFTLNTMMSGLKSFNFSPHTSISSNHDNFAPSY